MYKLLICNGNSEGSANKTEDADARTSHKASISSQSSDMTFRRAFACSLS